MVQRVESDTQNPTSKELNQAYEFRNPGLRTVSSLINAGAIKFGLFKGKYNTPSNNYAFDIDKAVSVLEEIEAPEASEPPISEHERELLGVKSKKLYRKVIKTFVDRQILPAAVAYHAGRLIRVEDLSIGKETEKHRFFYYNKHDLWPEKPEDRAVIRLGFILHRNSASNLGILLNEAGVSLPDEMVGEIALTASLAHEYGHALQETMELLSLEKAKQRDPKVNSGTIHIDLGRLIWRTIGADPVIEDIVRDEPDEKEKMWSATSTLGERVAMGFEHLALRYALEKAGLNEDQITKVFMYGKEHFDDILIEDFKRFKEFIEEQNLSFRSLGNAIHEIYFGLQERGNQHLADKVPFPFSAHDLGYARPFTENQIRNFVRLFPL